MVAHEYLARTAPSRFVGRWAWFKPFKSSHLVAISDDRYRQQYEQGDVFHESQFQKQGSMTIVFDAIPLTGLGIVEIMVGQPIKSILLLLCCLISPADNT